MVKDYDVIVIGGGTAGSAAAIACAMAGVSTLIVERNSYLGGSASGGQVTPMMHTGIDDDCGKTYLNEVIKKKMTAEGNAADDHTGNDGWLNPEMLKITLEELYTEYGGDILYLTELIDTVVEDNRIKGLIVHNKSGLTQIKGKVFIDCTGDADLAYLAGVPCFSGDEKEHNNQAMSLRFMLGNVDIKRLKDFQKDIGDIDILEYPLAEIASLWEWDTPLSRLFKKGLEEHKIEYEDGVYVQAFAVPGMPGVMSFNCPQIPDIYHTLDAAKVSHGLVVGRKMIKRLHSFLKEAIPGFEHSFLLSVADMPGIRESRRIKGLYVLSEEDYIRRARFEDAVARTAYPIDIHGLIDEKKLGIKAMEKGEYFEIPYRCMVPEKIDNLLVAGRCLSATFIAQSATRIQPTCRALGEAAGIAAAYSVKNKQKVNELDGKTVRKLMEAQDYTSMVQ